MKGILEEQKYCLGHKAHNCIPLPPVLLKVRGHFDIGSDANGKGNWQTDEQQHFLITDWSVYILTTKRHVR